MGSLYQRGNVWWAKYYVDGRPVRKSCETEVKQEALAKLNEWEGGALRGEPVLNARRVRFDDLMDGVTADYKINGKKTLRWVKRRIELHLRPFFAGRRAASISTPDVQAYIVKRQGEGASNAEVNRELAILKRGFNLAVRASLLTRRPYIPSLKERNVRQGFAGEVEALAIQEALSQDLRPLVRFLYTFGWRCEEAEGLQWTQVSLAEGTVRHDPTQNKTEDSALLYLTEGLLDDFRALWQAAVERVRQEEPGCSLRRVAEVEPYVFTRNGKPIRDFRGAWASACEKAGVPNLVPHDLRRSAVRNLIRAGVPERVAMTISGHKTRSVFDRYNIVSESDLKAAAKKLEVAVAVTALEEERS